MGEEILLKAQSKLRVLGKNLSASLKGRWEGKTGRTATGSGLVKRLAKQTKRSV